MPLIRPSCEQGKASCNAIANAVFPDAVGPIKHITGGNLLCLVSILFIDITSDIVLLGIR